MARPHEQFPRPQSPYYETRFPYFSQGDVLEDVPFAVLGPDLLWLDEWPGTVVQPVVALRGMILSRTCDFRRPPAADLLADPARAPYTLQAHVLVAPLHLLSSIAERWGSNRESNLHLARHYDALRRFMYLPPLAGDTEEWLVDLTQIGSIDLELAGKLARLAQLTFRATQQLQYKLVMAATGVVTDPSVYQPPMD